MGYCLAYTFHKSSLTKKASENAVFNGMKEVSRKEKKNNKEARHSSQLDFIVSFILLEINNPR